MSFETRGRLARTPVQKCLRCGRGLLLKLPKGQVEVIPADQWLTMQQVWAEEFPEDPAPPTDQAATPAFDPTASGDQHDGPGRHPGEIFSDALAEMTEATSTRDDLHPNGRKLAIACLSAAASTADDLGEVGDTDLDSTEDLIARIAVSDDDRAAMRVLFALSWYFAFAFQGPALKSVDRDRWLDAMQEALDPKGVLRPDDPTHLVDLFESYLAWTPEATHKFPMMLCRWVDLHLGLAWSDTPDIASVVLVLPACQAHKDDFMIEAGRPVMGHVGEQRPATAPLPQAFQSRSHLSSSITATGTTHDRSDEGESLRLFATVQVARSRQVRRIIGWGLLAVVMALLTLATWVSADAAAQDPYSTDGERSYVILWGPMVFGTWRALRAFELRRLNKALRNLAF